MQLVLGNWANFQLQVSLATENQLHKTVAKWQISSSDGKLHSHQRKCHNPRDRKVVLHTCVQTSWPPKGHCVESKPKVHEQVLASVMEAHGVEA